MKQVLCRLTFAATALSATLAVAGCGGGGSPAGPGGGPGAGKTDVGSGGQEPASEPGKYGGRVTTASISDPKTLNFWVSAETSSTDILTPVFESLNQRNSYTLEYEPRLADLPKVSPDGLTYTYTLKEGVTWSDGQPLTADDVVFTLDVILDPSTQTIMREGLLIDVPQPDGTFKREPFKYRKVDDRTVEFTLPVKFAPAESVFSGIPIAPRHKLEAPYKAGKFNQTWGVNTPVKELVSSGAWIIAEYVPGQRLVYKRNPRSPFKSDDGKPLPYLDEWVVLVVPDLNTTTLKFRSGETDVMTSVPQTDYPLLKKDESSGNYQVINRGPSWGFSFLTFNQNPNAPGSVPRHLIKLFQDARFRRAVSHAIDRERMVEDIFLGLARPQYGPISPANKAFYKDDIPKYEFDTAKAKTLLAEIPGLRDTDGNGWLEFEGKEVRFPILTNAENELRKQMATIITNDLKKVGINAEFTPVTFNSLIPRLDSSYDWQAIVLSFTGGPEPYAGSNIWRSSGPSHMWWPKQKKPATEWEAEIDKLWTEGAQELDPAKRKAIYDRWQVLVAEQQPFNFTVVPDVISAVRNRFGNLKPASLSMVWNIEEWFDKSATRENP